MSTCPHVHNHNRDRRTGHPGHDCQQRLHPAITPPHQWWNQVTPLSGHLWHVGTCCTEPSMHPTHAGTIPRHLPSRYRLRRPLTPSLSRVLDPSPGPHGPAVALQSANHPEDGVISVICTLDTNRDASTAMGDEYGGRNPHGTASRTRLSAPRTHSYHDTERRRSGCETPGKHRAVPRQRPAIVPGNIIFHIVSSSRTADPYRAISTETTPHHLESQLVSSLRNQDRRHPKTTSKRRSVQP